MWNGLVWTCGRHAPDARVWSTSSTLMISTHAKRATGVFWVISVLFLMNCVINERSLDEDDEIKWTAMINFLKKIQSVLTFQRAAGANTLIGAHYTGYSPAKAVQSRVHSVANHEWQHRLMQRHLHHSISLSSCLLNIQMRWTTFITPCRWPRGFSIRPHEPAVEEVHVTVGLLAICVQQTPFINVVCIVIVLFFKFKLFRLCLVMTGLIYPTYRDSRTLLFMTNLTYPTRRLGHSVLYHVTVLSVVLPKAPGNIWILQSNLKTVSFLNQRFFQYRRKVFLFVNMLAGSEQTNKHTQIKRYEEKD